MSNLGKVIKQPDEIEFYTIDYTEDTDDTETVSNPTVAAALVSGTSVLALTVDSPVVLDGGRKMKFRATGGSAGCTYKVTVTVDTDTGRKLQDELKITIKEY